MKSSHLLLLGQTGSGKTSLARILVDPVPRLVVFDQSRDGIWDTIGGAFHEPGRAVDFLYDHAEDDFQAVFRFRKAETYLPILGALYELHAARDLPPLVVVLEESTVWSETHEIPPELEAVATRGRREGLVLVSIAQETTQLNPTVRRQAFLQVALRHSGMPTDLRQQLTREDRERVKQLETVTPYTTPRYGDHFLTVPPDVDPYRHLLEAVGQSSESLPADYRPPRPE